MSGSSRRLGIGVVGGGAIADVYLRQQALPDESRIVALADHDPAVLRARASVLGAAAAYAGIDELLADPSVDAVVVALPHDLHRTAVVRALEAGKHVICEKPLGLTIDELDAVAAAQARTGQRVVVRSYLRALEHHQWVQAAVSARLFGDVVLFRGHFASDRRAALDRPDDWHGRWDRAGGGVVADSGYHLLDLSRYWLGEVVEVEARTWSTLATRDRPEDLALIRLAHTSGATSSLSFVWRDDLRPFRWEREVYGSEGSAFVCDSGDASVLRARTRTEPVITSSVEDWWRVTNERAFEDCVSVLLRNTPARDGAVDVDDAAQTSRVVQAAYLSAECGAPVNPATVPDDYRAGPRCSSQEGCSSGPLWRLRVAKATQPQEAPDR